MRRAGVTPSAAPSLQQPGASPRQAAATRAATHLCRRVDDAAWQVRGAAFPACLPYGLHLAVPAWQGMARAGRRFNRSIRWEAPHLCQQQACWAETDTQATCWRRTYSPTPPFEHSKLLRRKSTSGAGQGMPLELQAGAACKGNAAAGPGHAQGGISSGPLPARRSPCRIVIRNHVIAAFSNNLPRCGVHDNSAKAAAGALHKARLF